MPKYSLNPRILKIYLICILYKLIPIILTDLRLHKIEVIAESAPCNNGLLIRSGPKIQVIWVSFSNLLTSTRLLAHDVTLVTVFLFFLYSSTCGARTPPYSLLPSSPLITLTKGLKVKVGPILSSSDEFIWLGQPKTWLSLAELFVPLPRIDYEPLAHESRSTHLEVCRCSIKNTITGTTRCS